jgi:hypothetical protein
METDKKLTEVRCSLDQAKRILDGTGRYVAEEWMLLATLVGDADLVLRGDRQAEPELLRALDEVVKDLKEVTSNFTSPDFLKASASARRRNPELFRSTV